MRAYKKPDEGLQCYNRRKNCHAHLQGKRAIMARAAVLCAASFYGGAFQYLMSVAYKRGEGCRWVEHEESGETSTCPGKKLIALNRMLHAWGIW